MDHNEPASPAETRDGVLHELVRSLGRRNTFSAQWQPNAVELPAGQCAQLCRGDDRRLRLTLWTDSANTAPIFFSPSVMNYAPNAGAGAIALAPGVGEPLVMHHAGEVFAYSDADTIVYVMQEYCR